MFDETFHDHINECIQLNLVIFTQDLHNLLVLKESFRISPHDFIRRAIFAVKKCATLLQKSDYLITNRMVKSSDESNGEDDEAMDVVENKPKPTTKPNMDSELSFFNYYDVDEEDEPKKIVQSSSKKSMQQTPTASAAKCDLCELMFDSVVNLEIHNFKFHNKLPPKPTPNSNYPLPPEAVSVADLAKKQQLLDLFENDNFNVDYLSKLKTNKVMNNNVRESSGNTSTSSYQPIDLIKNNLKLIKCLQCEDRFFTISHLDEHVVRKHPFVGNSKAKQQNNDVGRRRNGNKQKSSANESINSFNYYNN
jgi:hypothetical protein